MLRVTVIIFLCALLDKITCFCPSQCSCHDNDINCSNKGLGSLGGIETSTNTFHRIDLSTNEVQWLPSVRVRHLDASSNLIEHIPELAPPIETLRLKRNKIKSVSWKNCSASLKMLDVSDNPLKEVDLNCPGLEFLNVSDADIEVLSDKLLLKLKSLQFLHMDRNPVKKITGDLSSDSLEFLTLSQTELRYIKPTLLTGLRNLRLLDISGNRHIHTLNPTTGVSLLLANKCALETIDFSGMPRLMSLEINDNHMRSLVIPGTLSSLKARNNAIYDIELANLMEADLSRNSIVSIKLKQMESLNISGNPISTLKLDSINTLDASMCRISAVVPGKAKLIRLDLSHNALESFPGGFSVKKLDLSYNRLSSFKAKIDGVEEVRLTGNRLVLAEDVVPQGFMHLGDNPWTCDCKMGHLYDHAVDLKALKCAHPKNVSGLTWAQACHKSKIPKWMLDHPYIPFVVSAVLLTIAVLIFYWLKRKLAAQEPDSPEGSTRTIRGSESRLTVPEPQVQNQLPSYEEALLMPGIVRKKNAPTQTRSYEVLSKRLSSSSI